jgi:hypothetical protein
VKISTLRGDRILDALAETEHWLDWTTCIRTRPQTPALAMNFVSHVTQFVVRLSPQPSGRPPTPSMAEPMPFFGSLWPPTLAKKAPHQMRSGRGASRRAFGGRHTTRRLWYNGLKGRTVKYT